MRKLLVMSVLLLGTAWVAAQTSPSSSSDQSSSTPSQSSSNPSTQATSGSNYGSQTIEGCLSGSNGNFTLTDKSGTSYQLAGDTSKLSDHVGQDVQISGSSSQNSSASASSPSSSSGTGGASSGASAQPTLNVSSVTKVSDTCSNSGGSGTPR